MALTVTFLTFLLLVCELQMQGSSAAVTDVFVKTGDDFILNLTEAEIPPNSRICLWQFKDDSLVEFLSGSQPNVINDRSGKVEVIEKSYSVKLKDLQKSHSGIYTAKAISPKDQILTQYNVTVQDPVSPVDLSFTYTSCSSSSSFSLTATCRADDSSISITLRCEKQTCNQDGGERRLVTKSGSSLHVYRLHKSIVCSHSNQVSRNESIENIENRCNQHGGPRDHYFYWEIRWILLVLLLLTVCNLHIYIHKKGDKHNFDNKVVNEQTETLNETAEDEVRFANPTNSTGESSMTAGATSTRSSDQ